MKIYNNVNFIDKKFVNSVLAIGNFDGVHLGHQELLKKAYIFSRKVKKKFGILTFDPLPKDFFNKTDNRILNIEDKIDIVKKFRADFFIKQNFNRNFSKISHDNFVKRILLKKLSVYSIFIGKDFRFGFKRKGNIFFLKKFSKNNNFKIFIINFKKFNNYKISSSKIRSLIQAGKVNLVNKVMGMPWSISGRVIKGKKFGRRIGFPTANIKILNQIKPLFGVYSVKIIFNKKTYKGIANFGVRPTFGSSNPILEVNVFEKTIIFIIKISKSCLLTLLEKRKNLKTVQCLLVRLRKILKSLKLV